jgi:hypothetical protein
MKLCAILAIFALFAVSTPSNQVSSFMKRTRLDLVDFDRYFSSFVEE